jgi:hypothetical protein
MNKKNTVGGQMWTPALEQQMQQEKKQNNALDDLEDILQENPDNIRFYKPE